MASKFLLTLLASSILVARENPFQSEKTVDEIPFSSNYVQKPDELQKMSFQLPESAKIVEAIEVVYQNNDGSMDRKRIDINRVFDATKNLSFGYLSNEPVINNQQNNSNNNKIDKPIISVSNKNNNKKIIDNKKPKVKTGDTNNSTVNNSSQTVITTTKTIKTTKKSSSTVSQNGAEEKVLKNDVSTSTVESEVKSIGDSDIVVTHQTQNQQNNADPFANYGNHSSNSNSKTDNSAWNVGSDMSSDSGTNFANNQNQNENETNKNSDDDEVSGDGKSVTVSIGTPRFSQFEFNPKDKSIKIATTDKKIRHFMLIRPNRIVIDFARELTFQNQTFDVKTGIFKEMKLSKKSSTDYRIMIYIAEDYRYKLNRTESGYEIKCYK